MMMMRRPRTAQSKNGRAGSARPGTSGGRRPQTSGGRPQTSGGRPQTSGGRPQTSGGRPQTSGERPQTSSGGRPQTSNGRPQTSNGRPQTSNGRPQTADRPPKEKKEKIAARPQTAKAARIDYRIAIKHEKQIERELTGRKKRKGWAGCCVPTFATMGVVCLMWLPKIFLTIGIAFTISGMVLMILGSQDHLRYESGRTSGAVLLGFGIVFIVISSIGLYLKKLMRSVPDPETGEERYEISFNNNKEDIYQVEDDYRRPKSALSHTTPNAAKMTSIANGGARPKTIQNGRPLANGNVNMSNGRPSSAVTRLQSTDSPNLRSQNSSSSVRPDSSRSRTNISPRSARSAIEIEYDDEITISRDRPFVTRSSASLNSSLGSSGGLKAQVEIHAPPAINIISDTSFSNKAFEDDNADNLSIHPLATLEPEAEEALARSVPASPMFTPRHLQKEVVVSDELSDEDSF